MTRTVGDGNSEVCAWRERFASVTKLRSARTPEASGDFAPRHGLTRMNAWRSSPTNRSSFFMVCLLWVGSFMGAPAPAALHRLSRAIRDFATPESTPLFLSENAALTRRAAIKSSRRYALMKEPDPQTQEEYAARSLRRQREREQREEAAFLREMERQTRLYPHASFTKVPDEFPRQLTSEEIAALSTSDFAIYSAAMRELKRRKHLKKREDAADKPGKSGGYQPGVL